LSDDQGDFGAPIRVGRNYLPEEAHGRCEQSYDDADKPGASGENYT